jgi:dienelactone hydrolase
VAAELHALTPPCRWLVVTGLLLLAAGPALAADPPPVADLADGRVGAVRFASVTPTGYFQLARRQATAPATIAGTLRLPAGASERVSAVVISHGSSGVTEDREGWWAARLSEAGFATFVVDSFGLRGVRQTATDQTQLSTAANVADALAALRLLATHPRIDARRIAVLGFSKGGQVALYTALEPFRRAILDEGPRFAAHVALYPYCSDWYVTEHVTGAPMLWLLGERDDYTPIVPCREYAQWFASKGVETLVVVYPGAYHDFDSLRAPAFAGSLVSGRNCDVRVDLDRFTVMRRTNGEDITATASTYGRNCLTKGATVGGDRQKRDRALLDASPFLQKVLGP